jgi:hypothetical protein
MASKERLARQPFEMGTRALFSVLLAGLAALFLNMHSLDASEYAKTFAAIKNDTPYPTSEFLFWGMIDSCSSIGLSISSALFFIFTLGLMLKFEACAKLADQPGRTLILVYFATFYLLHEGTQLRIACGLAFSLWSCALLTSKRYALALLFCCVSAGFHITAPLLTVVFGLCLLSLSFQKSAPVFCVAGATCFLLKISIALPLISSFTGLLGGHYTSYTSKLIDQGQNKSGLAFVYAFCVLGLLISLKLWARKNPDDLSSTFNPLLATSIYGVGLIFWLYETVAIGSRLSDVLLITIVPVIAVFIANANLFCKTLSYAALALFFAARVYQLFPAAYALS